MLVTGAMATQEESGLHSCDVQLSAMPTEVLVLTLSPLSRRCDVRALGRQWRQLVERCFDLTRFPAPQGGFFCIDFEIDRPMSKDTYCARFFDKDGRVEGFTTFLNWAPVYYRSASGESRGVRRRLNEEDSCMLWRMSIRARDHKEQCSGHVDNTECGHLKLTEGVSDQSVSHLVGRISREETIAMMRLLDYRKNAAAVVVDVEVPSSGVLKM